MTAAASRQGGPPDLPVAGVLDRVVAASRGGAVVVTAPPGSGKTTLVPAAVLDDLPADQRVVLLQPRRLAARSVARQIARLREGEVGDEVGYQVRFDARVGPRTRLVVETTGIMLRRLVGDVALPGIGAVVLDEFHERSLEMDLVLGLLVQLRRTLRPDLRIVVMSATLAADPVAALIGDAGGPCPAIHAEGRLYPVDVRYLRHGDRRELVELVADAVPRALAATDGHVLVFLPGVGEIRRCEDALAGLVGREGHAVVPLFGELPPERQDDALAEMGCRKVILATNVAETSLTIPGVTAVIDSGLARQLRISPDTGLPRLDLVPISKAAAEQRAGRAGRTAPGVCWRLWDESAHLRRPAAECPETLRGDCTAAILQLVALGEQEGFPWLDPPPPEALATARNLLGRLGAIVADSKGRDRLTPLGAELVVLPTHPRLGRLLLAGAAHGVLREAAVAAALLSDRDPFRAARHAGGPRDRATVRSPSDVVDRVVALQAFHAGRPLHDPALELHPGAAHAILQAADQLFGLVAAPRAARAGDPGLALMRSLLEAFPDRLARLRPGTQDRATMVGGRGVRLAASRVRGEEFFLAIDVHDAGGVADVRLASAVDRRWLDEEPLAAANLHVEERLMFHPSRRQVEARTCTSWLDLVLDETPATIRDADAAAILLAREAATQFDRIRPAADAPAGRFLARCRWLASTPADPGLPPLDDAALVATLPTLCAGRRGLAELEGADWLAHLRGLIGHELAAAVDRLAPAEFDLPSGRRCRITYEPGAAPVLAARIQDFFGLRETPSVGGGRVPLSLHLLAPNNRPQQVTSDLASFWKTTYPQVKKELKRRYPKHAWPDIPGERTP